MKTALYIISICVILLTYTISSPAVTMSDEMKNTSFGIPNTAHNTSSLPDNHLDALLSDTPPTEGSLPSLMPVEDNPSRLTQGADSLATTQACHSTGATPSQTHQAQPQPTRDKALASTIPPSKSPTPIQLT